MSDVDHNDPVGTPNDFAQMFSKRSNHDLTAAIAGEPDQLEPEPPAAQPAEQLDKRHAGLAKQFGLPVRVAALIDLDQPLDKVFANAKALQRHVHGPPPAVDFDGGPRETAPMPSNPAAEHGQFLIQVLREHQGGGGSWPN